VDVFIIILTEWVPVCNSEGGISAIRSDDTDTEHLAALYFTYLGNIQKRYSARDMKDADVMERADLKVQAIQMQVLGQNTPNSMNL
jgi:glutamine amidotransferase